MKSRLIGIGIFILLGLRLSAQSFLDHISLEDGLSQGQVQCLLQDSRGFVWFGTQHGLNRYDGYEIRHFYQNPFDSTTLSGDDIFCLFEDSQRRLWVGTRNGLNYYDPVKESFVQYNFNSSKKELRNRQITGIAEDRWRTLWVSTWEGLWRLIPTKDSFQIIHIEADTLKSTALQSNLVRNVIADAAKNIWLATPQGLQQVVVQNPEQVVEKQTFAFRVVTKEFPATAKYEEFPIHQMYADRSQRIWFASGRCLFVYDLKKNVMQELTTQLVELRFPISALLMDRFGDLWVGTFNGGLFRYKVNAQLQLSIINHIRENLAVKKGLKSNSILSLHESKELDEDIVWIGTREGGVHLYSRSKNSFRQWDQVLARENNAAANATFSICTDSYGYLWVGTLQGLFQIERSTGKYKKFLMDATIPRKNSHQAIFEDSERNLWVGSNGGLFHFDRVKNTFKPVTLPAVKGEQPGISRIYEDSHKNLWIGTFQYLLKIKLTDGGTTQLLSQIKQEKNTWRLPPIHTIREDQKGNIWVGTTEGLFLYYPKSGEFSRFYSNPNDPKSLIDNSILDIHCSPDGQVWLSSPKGLSKLIWENGKVSFEHFTERDGLANSFVYGALSDRRKRLWISTNAGISCFNPKTKEFRNYDSNDGLANREFNSGAFHQSKDGELFFGGMSVLVSFHPEQMIENQHLPKTAITAFRKMEQPLPFDSLLAADGKIRLKYNDDLFGFQLAALDFTNPGKNQYAYQLENLQQNWVYTGTQRYINFTHLRPGDYVLRVKSANNQGLWNDNAITSIPIYITPPFWQTWWFLSAATLFVGMVVVSGYRYRVRSKVRLALEMERVKLEENERVRKLAAQDLHDEFGNTLTRISLLTELIKTRTQTADADVNSLLTKISDNTSRMYQGTKDFIWSINPENDSFHEVAIRLKDFGDDAFDKTGITFQVSGIDETLKAMRLPMGVSRHIVLLFKEAMSNTLKHAFATDAYLRFSVENGRARIEWRDNGIGFDTNKPKGGNGLQNMQSRAKRINGQVRIESNADDGTRVTLEL
ncbi:MAG: two-component regulator propeller domain-containing protein [Saprospiraceae bacterium]